jgi:hypothetical protein
LPGFFIKNSLESTVQQASDVYWTRDGDGWVLKLGRRKLGRVFRDSKYPGMWRSRRDPCDANAAADALAAAEIKVLGEDLRAQIMSGERRIRQFQEGEKRPGATLAEYIARKKAEGVQ